MPDMWMDVDTALSEVPVNKVALIDDTDFKTREEAVAYNATGLELIWHFTTTAGATSATVVTPTTGGVYDWAHQDGGLYTIEIPASGGASINNDTEGFGFFSGKADGVLPWVGPTIGFRAAAMNNALIDGGDVLDVNLTQIGGVEQSATDLKDFADTGYDPTSHKVAGVVLVDTTTTNTDMRGTDSALLATSAPANFGDLAITASTGLVTVGTNNDKTGYSLTAGTGLGNQTADITGSLSGSVGSVLGGINTSAGTITTLDGLDTAQDTQHSTTQASVTSLLNNLFWTLAIPPVIKIPSTGTDDYILEIALYDGAGNPEAPDAAPTMAVTDNDGNSLSARLGSTTGSLQSTGRYRWTYTSSSAHTPAQLIFFITVTEGSTARVVECSATLESATATVSGFSNNAITSAAITDGAFTQGKFASNYYSGVAANVYQYDTANCDGSAANLSLYSLIHSILRSSRTADSLIIYESDGVTVHVTSALTTVTTVAYISTVSTPAT